MYELKENQKMIYTFNRVNYQPTFNHFDVAKAYKYVLKAMSSPSSEFYRHEGGNLFDDPIHFEKPHQLPLENISFKTALNIVCGVNPNINDTFMTDGFDSTQSIVRVNNSDSQDLFDEYGKFCQFVYGNEDELLPVFSNNKENKVNTEIFLKWATDNGFLKIQELPKFPHNKSNAIRKIINPIANNLRKENPEIEKVDLADLIIQKISKECKDGEKFTKSNLIREYLSN